MSSQPDKQAPAVNRRKVGDYVVSYLSDGYLDGSFGFLQGIDEAEAKSLMEAAQRPPLPHIAIASFAIQGNGRTILIDGGTGGFNGWGGRFAESLGAAGIEPREVDTILLTHAHVDHVGGLTRQGAPLCPQAEVIVHQAEVGFWRDDAIMNSVPDASKPFFVAARAAFDAYDKNLKLVSGGEVAPGIEIIHLPGHTPGHSGYRISSGSDTLLVWGDIAHLPDIQIRKPEVTIGFDADPDQARATRMKMLDEVSSDGLIIAGPHLNMPGFIKVERSASGYRKVDMPWLPALV